MAEAAGKEETQPSTLKDKAEENEALDGKTSSPPSQQTPAKDDSDEELECAVCLQKCVHPVRLPCTHIFCFLCVKGVANQSKRCAMCRQEIPADFLDHPTLLSNIEAEKEELLPGGYQWFYEGRNGWWQYDERTSHELEAAYGSGQRACEVLVAGFLYIIDFDRMVQLRRNDPSRRRRIKRDLSSIPKKGVAGIKLPSQLEAELSALHTAAHAIHIPSHREGEMGDSTSPAPSNNNNNDLCPRTPTAPSNTPQTPHTPSAASSSSGSPDTSEPTHLHALTADSHHQHYHHHLPPHYPNTQHNNQLHIPHHLANNLSVGSEHGTFPPPPAGQPTRSPPLPSSIHPQPALHATQPSLEPRDASAPVPPASSSLPAVDVEEVVYQVDQLSLLPDTPEFYPLDGPDETEQYHLTLSSEDE